MTTAPTVPAREEIRQALRVVIDPELHQNIVDLGMVRKIDFPAEGHVSVTVSLTTPGCPIRSHFQQAVSETVRGLPGVTGVHVDFDVLSEGEKSNLQQRLGLPGGLPQGSLAAVKNVVCVASGKGGVGKSTITASLAAALHVEGKRAAALDADVWGYSIPRMLGVHGRPRVNAQRKIMPLEAHGGMARSRSSSSSSARTRRSSGAGRCSTRRCASSSRTSTGASSTTC